MIGVVIADEQCSPLRWFDGSFLLRTVGDAGPYGCLTEALCMRTVGDAGPYGGLTEAFSCGPSGTPVPTSVRRKFPHGGA